MVRQAFLLVSLVFLAVSWRSIFSNTHQDDDSNHRQNSFERDVPSRLEAGSLSPPNDTELAGKLISHGSQKGQGASATEDAPLATAYGRFVDPSDASTWRRSGGDIVIYGPFVDPNDSSTWFEPVGPRGYGDFVDPLAQPRLLDLLGKQRDFGSIVDPEDPYTWRESGGMPEEIGDDYFNPAP